jgi:hypothetical protein
MASNNIAQKNSTPQEANGMPGITPTVGVAKTFQGYSAKVMKVDLEDLGDVATLENVLTRGMTTDEIIVLERDKFTFMDKYYVVITYMEKND